LQLELAPHRLWQPKLEELVVLCDRSRSAARECFQPIRDNESLRAASVFRHEDILLLCDDEVDAYGARSIKHLTAKFELQLAEMGVQEDQILPQWSRFKRKIRRDTRLAAQKYDTMWDWMFQHRSDTIDPQHCYDLLCLVVLVRCWMLDTSCCERGFSVMNLLRSAVRNRLSTELCRVLMTIALIGGERYKHASTVPVDEIYKVWKAEKKRYCVASDPELWGKKQWEELMGELRELRQLGE
jgi:hypothetical protein